jgi:hypothetical protein
MKAMVILKHGHLKPVISFTGDVPLWIWRELPRILRQLNVILETNRFNDQRFGYKPREAAIMNCGYHLSRIMIKGAKVGSLMPSERLSSSFLNAGA